MFKIIFSAIKNTKNIYRSIFGYNIKKNIFNNKNSDLYKSNWNIIKLIQLNSYIFLPKLPIASPSWLPVSLKKIIFGGDSKYIPDIPEIENNTCILYVNGIVSNEDVVIKINKKQLKEIFNRPINVIYNDSDSLIMDLIESAIGKGTKDLTEASTIALYTISRKLLDPNINKIVVICYSQGTIIIAKVIQSLFTPTELLNGHFFYIYSYI